MSLWSDLRAVVLLKRIAKAEERQAAALETLADVAKGLWLDKHPVHRKSTVEFGMMDVEELNKRWARQQEADLLGETLPEDEDEG
jgi:hypothetical protein